MPWVWGGPWGWEWALSLVFPLSPIAAFPHTGSSFPGPGGFPEPFPAPGAPGTPTLSDFAPGPPPISYQSDIPGSLLAPEKPPAPPLPAQVRWAAGGGRSLSLPPRLPGREQGGLRGREGLTATLSPSPLQLPLPGRMEPSHPSVQPGLHNPAAGSQPAQTLHHLSAPARAPLGPPGPVHAADLAFPPGTGDGSEPALDVSTAEEGLGGAWLGVLAATGWVGRS